MNTNIQARPQVQTQKQEQEVKRTYKDSVFVTIFHEKSKLIELYNALFDTNYDESVPIDIVTIKDVLFRTLKNDLAFVLGGRFVVLVEHQSSINENMPLRDLMYISTVLKRMIDTTRLYREKRLKIPRPSFVVLLFRHRDKYFTTARRIFRPIGNSAFRIPFSGRSKKTKRMLYNSSLRCIISIQRKTQKSLEDVRR